MQASVLEAVPAALTAQESSPPAVELDIDAIAPDPENPWGGDDGDDDQGFASSIHALGVLQPPRVRRDEALGKWVITAGERRWRTAKAAGRKTILCVIDRQPPDRVRLHRERIAENLHRRGGRPVRLARALRTLQELGGYSLSQLAEAVQKDVSFVSRKLSLLKFSDAVLQAIDGGLLEESTAIEIAKVRDGQQREMLAQRALREPMTREQAAELVASLGRRRRAPEAPARPRKRVAVRLSGGATVTVTCPDSLSEMTMEVIRDTLEFALQEVRKAIRKQVPVAKLSAHFQQLAPAPAKAEPAVAQPAPVNPN